NVGSYHQDHLRRAAGGAIGACRFARSERSPSLLRQLGRERRRTHRREPSRQTPARPQCLPLLKPSAIASFNMDVLQISIAAMPLLLALVSRTGKAIAPCLLASAFTVLLG